MTPIIGMEHHHHHQQQVKNTQFSSLPSHHSYNINYFKILIWLDTLFFIFFNPLSIKKISNLLLVQSSSLKLVYLFVSINMILMLWNNGSVVVVVVVLVCMCVPNWHVIQCLCVNCVRSSSFVFKHLLLWYWCSSVKCHSIRFSINTHTQT